MNQEHRKPSFRRDCAKFVIVLVTLFAILLLAVTVFDVFKLGIRLGISDQ